MRRLSIKLIVGMMAFFIGLFFGSINFAEPSEKLPTIDVIADEEIVAELTPANTLTFGGKGDVACGFDADGNRASWTSYEASDGTTIASTLLLFEREAKAQKKLKALKAKASRVIESEPYLNYWKVKIGERLLFEKNKEFTLVTYRPDERTFNVTILTSSSLEHLREFDRQAESLKRSFEVNRLNP